MKLERMNLESVKCLEGEVYGITELSNLLVADGFEDICEFGDWEQLLEDGNVVVGYGECCEEHIQIYFDVEIMANLEEESATASYIRITEIREY